MKDNYLWENDPSLVPMTAVRQKQIENMAFRSIRNGPASAVEPSFKNDPERKAKYMEWLKANPA